MPDLDLSRLQKRLLSAGVAPRHVNRTMIELSDHFDDLVEQGRCEGLDEQSAQDAARSALGDLDDIAFAVRSRPELRSWAYRYPVLARVVYPLTCLALLPVAPVLIGYAHATQVARWTACLLLGGLVTAGMFLVLQLVITLG